MAQAALDGVVLTDLLLHSRVKLSDLLRVNDGMRDGDDTTAEQSAMEVYLLDLINHFP